MPKGSIAKRQELPWQEFERNFSSRRFDETEGFDVVRDLDDLGQSQRAGPFDLSRRRVVLAVGDGVWTQP